jgi:hypothetical protein
MQPTAPEQAEAPRPVSLDYARDSSGFRPSLILRPIGILSLIAAVPPLVGLWQQLHADGFALLLWSWDTTPYLLISASAALGFLAGGVCCFWRPSIAVWPLIIASLCAPTPLIIDALYFMLDDSPYTLLDWTFPIYQLIPPSLFPALLLWILLVRRIRRTLFV